METLNFKVSVLMSVYNGSQYLRESVDSILAQTFSDFEFIIIDDASNDNSWEILSDYAKFDARIKLFRNEENLGLTKSLNKGLQLATGKYIARQDADDISLPKRLEKQVAILDQRLEAVLASCNLEVINAHGELLRQELRSCDSKWVPWYLLFYNHLGGHSQVVFRREAVMNLGGYSEACRYGQDYELWCRLVKVGDVVILPEILHKQRRHSQGITTQKRSEQRFSSLNRSRDNIKRLIGQELSLEEVKDLRKFWSGPVFGNFPDSRKVGILHAKQQELAQAFLQKSDQQNSSDSEMYRQLRILIGQEFIYWIRSLSILHSFPARLNISRYAVTWYPKGVIEFWLTELWRVLSLAPHSLVKGSNREVSKTI